MKHTFFQYAFIKTGRWRQSEIVCVIIPRAVTLRAFTKMNGKARQHCLLLLSQARMTRSVKWLGCRLEYRGLEVRFPAEAEIFLFSKTSRPSPRPIRSPLQQGPGLLPLERVSRRPHLSINVCRRYELLMRYLHSPIYLHGLMLNPLQRQQTCFSIQYSSVTDKAVLYRNFHDFPPFDLLATAKAGLKWVCGSGGMTLTRENGSTRRKTCSGTLLPTTKLIRTGLGSNTGFHSDRAATNRLNHVTAYL